MVIKVDINCTFDYHIFGGLHRLLSSYFCIGSFSILCKDYVVANSLNPFLYLQNESSKKKAAKPKEGNGTLILYKNI